MKVVSGIIGSIVLLLTKACYEFENNTFARINLLSGFLYITGIFDGRMDDGFEATLNINDRDAGESSMTIPAETVSQNQTVLQGNLTGRISKNRIRF